MVMTRTPYLLNELRAMQELSCMCHASSGLSIELSRRESSSARLQRFRKQISRSLIFRNPRSSGCPTHAAAYIAGVSDLHKFILLELYIEAMHAAMCARRVAGFGMAQPARVLNLASRPAFRGVASENAPATTHWMDKHFPKVRPWLEEKSRAWWIKGVVESRTRWVTSYVGDGGGRDVGMPSEAVRVGNWVGPGPRTCMWDYKLVRLPATTLAQIASGIGGPRSAAGAGDPERVRPAARCVPGSCGGQPLLHAPPPGLHGAGDAQGPAALFERRSGGGGAHWRAPGPKQPRSPHVRSLSQEGLGWCGGLE